MLFNDWLAQAGRSKYKVAKDLNIQWTTIWRWTTGRGLPSPDMMRRVQEYTGGQVTPNDWVRAERAAEA